ncbi:MAG: penicillin-binding protein 2 [Thermoanaerobaculia bacterium]|nr:penicillin-binding protein 2 [Thermoanaerobaculia bacterium]
MSNQPIFHPAAERVVWNHGRLVVLCALAAGWLLLAMGRLYWLQVERHEHFLGKALEQQREVLELDAPRGTIYDARGRELAVSIEAMSVVADPVYLRRLAEPAPGENGEDENREPLDIDTLATQLAVVLGQGTAEVRAKLDSDKRFVWIERKVDRPVAERVASLDLPGIHLLPESKRYYPMGTLAAQIIGYVGTDHQGLAGLEAHYDAAVRTEKGRTTVLRDGRAGTLVYPGLGRSEARPGHDLHLTIDSVLQNIVERELAAGVESSNARSGQAVMLDPETGAVLAMASVPTFDPNRWNDYPKNTWRNPPVQDAYEPGSTFKMVTLAAALESGHVDPLLPIHCGNGVFRYGSKTTINDHKSFGELTVREVIANSSNVGAIHLGRFAGEDLLFSTIRRFGFGEPTGIDLPGESSGQLRSADRWSKTDPFYISFGQGVGVTAIQLTNAFAALANDGRRLRPHVVRRVGDRDIGRHEVRGLVAAPSTVRQVKTILEQVVLDGTATSAALDGYRAAGKTGTAEKAVPGRGYLDGRYVASFVGFAPLERPQIVLLVLLDEPLPRYHGGEVAAPVFRNVVQEALLYLGEQAPQRGRPLGEILSSRLFTEQGQTPVDIEAPVGAPEVTTGGVG